MTKNLTSAAIDGAMDLLDKCSTPGSRAGHAVERVAKLTRGGVSPAVTAMQMSLTDPAGQTFDVRDVEAYRKLYRSTESGTPLTARQTSALLRDAKAHTLRYQDQHGADDGDADYLVPVGA